MKHRSIRRKIPVGDSDVVLAYAPINMQWWILMGKGPAHKMSILEKHNSYAEAKKRFDYIIPKSKGTRARRSR